MDHIECVVAGAGVVGLAVARALALSGRDVIVIEANPAIGMETSSRNSEVIHAGIYYPTGSLKARLCVEGRDQLYAYCAERAIPHQRCGKLIVSTSAEQNGKLQTIRAQAHANGCTEVTLLSAAQAQELEPSLSCTAALHSPNTGIIDSHALMLALQGDAENAGAVFAFDSRVVAGRCDGNAIELEVQTGTGDAFSLRTDLLVNCAGLWAPKLARSIAGLDDGTVPPAYFAKGNYYSLAGRAPFSRLIYPVPEPGGLGVHLTLDLGGQARFGPDVEWLEGESLDYQVDPRRADKFYREIRAYWPNLPDDALQPAYAGIRPKISGPGEPAADFVFATHGKPSYLGLYGIESPGLTASLAIATHVLGLTAA
ncbi:L-2-hydroxyglutarate oxidase LhgO [Noviherbaspirillum humi]|uniref:L-2-hydroxyglutarate oxidase LhgO n=1 Tax=Noviherbaspirillum humi TaxID=1688639 RepID=A0A239G1E2_9BURK|nr:NAD(P)/FAD-dependent oxidoreductase [Noviherbaspirillum humi]SNS62880.1 L-2-hydroxyglutarate oxidase LhgO [Noviherbaspirillum humi]